MSSGDEKRAEMGPGYVRAATGDGMLPVGSSSLASALRRKAEPLSTVERLHVRRDDLERDLKMVNEAIEVLKANPEVEKVLHLVSRVDRL